MRYIIMCGSNHEKINGVPRQLVTINGERILDRTIRLLTESGIHLSDISITATDPAFNDCGAQVIDYDSAGDWVNCFLQLEEPTCYIFGDVYFSEDAIRTIVNTETDTIQFFASAPPFAPNYPKTWAEPFAFKVVDQELFHLSIERTKQIKQAGGWRREPIAWELWQVIKGTTCNQIIFTNYQTINDYTCDIDCSTDIDYYRRLFHDS